MSNNWLNENAQPAYRKVKSALETAQRKHTTRLEWDLYQEALAVLPALIESHESEGVEYARMRLTQIASGDYRACGHTAEVVAADAQRYLRTPEQPQEGKEWHTPEGKPIFGEGSPHDVGEHLDRLVAQPDSAEMVERITDAIQRRARDGADSPVDRGDAEDLARAALSGMPASEDTGLVEALQAELRHYKGRPAVDGKPLELQSRDELLAVVRRLEAENERLSMEANAGRQAEAEADAEAKELAEALEKIRKIIRIDEIAKAKHAVILHPDAVRQMDKIAAEALVRYKAQPRPTFQSRVAAWMDACFGPAISADKVERNHRFLEESLELVQALGCSREEALQLVDYVFGRPVGEPSQEVGGVMVTLAALCLALGLDMDGAAETELARVWTRIDVIRAKQAAKPRGSALPVSRSYNEKAAEDIFPPSQQAAGVA